MALRPEVIVVPVELSIEDVAKGILHSLACIVYAQKTGTPVDFRGKPVPKFVEAMMHKTAPELEEVIDGAA